MRLDDMDIVITALEYALTELETDIDANARPQDYEWRNRVGYLIQRLQTIYSVMKEASV
jgi:hypothetical protein